MNVQDKQIMNLHSLMKKIRIVSEKWIFQKVASFTKVLPCLMPKKACGTSYFSFSPLPLPFSIYVCLKVKKVYPGRTLSYASRIFYLSPS